MSVNEISIIGHDSDYLLIVDTGKGYKGRIHKSLIEANEIEVINGKFNVPDTLYKAWFEDSISEEYNNLCNMFYDNIPLFVAKREVILKEKRFNSILSPRYFYEGMFIGGRVITVGELLFLWEDDDDFYGQCECGGKLIVCYFWGSPLSGSCYNSCICLQCKNKSTNTRLGNFGKITKVKGLNHPFAGYSKKAVAVKDLVSILKDKMNISDAVNKDIITGISGKITLQIGSSKVSNDVFAKIAFGDSIHFVKADGETGEI